MRRAISTLGWKLTLATSVATASITGTPAWSEEFTLSPVVIEGRTVHPSQAIRQGVDRAYNSSRSSSGVGGSVLQNLNPVNTTDALRYNASGLINSPEAGDRFGSSKKVRTFGDFGASESIDGLPALKFQGQEGGGYNNTLVPSIAVEQIDVLKGGRAVQYGDGSDGGVIQTNIKSGRGYEDHQAISIDASTAREGIVQGEVADSTEDWDYYAAASGFLGSYDGDPSSLDKQYIVGTVGKLGFNFSEDTRAELLAIYDRSRPDIFRNGDLNKITTESWMGAATVDHTLSDINSVQAGAAITNTRSRWPARNRNRAIDNRILFADHNLSLPLSDTIDYDGTVGVEYKHTFNERDKTFDNSFDDYAVKSMNAFTFNDNLTLTAGLRYTWLNNEIILNGVEQADNLQDDAILSYQAGASYSVLDETRLRVSYATGFNRFFEKYGNFGTDALNPNGAQDEVVESKTMEIGINQGIHNGYIDVALYNIVQDNVPRRNGGAIQNVEVDQTGIEVEAFDQLTDSVSVSASYMHILDVEATRADGTNANGNVFFGSNGVPVPEHQASLRLDYRATEKWGIWGAAYVTTGFESYNIDGSVTERSGFTRLDIGTSYAVNDKLTLRARAENLLDERDFGQTIDGQTFDDDAKLGTVVWLGMDYTF
ncbi:TonB-dependent receptor [Hwanghaeella grinnelliae]|uniref:TonB-dependent receptor n=1 Tax=Hwanghaeella grinnelliae TaxID=2500179 RepID=A0A3S2Y497_9PROT|nr:TonB-dependent receptor [Hwanghaeella grinnelliae]RVU38134.1 TonB-dependent receptor [Hwanghaeella grinnelliae]